jgi:hypothetical protein
MFEHAPKGSETPLTRRYTCESFPDSSCSHDDWPLAGTQSAFRCKRPIRLKVAKGNASTGVPGAFEWLLLKMYTADMGGCLGPVVEDTLVRTREVATREARVAIGLCLDNVLIDLGLTREGADLRDTVLSRGNGEGRTNGEWAVRHLWGRNVRSAGVVVNSHERIYHI